MEADHAEWIAQSWSGARGYVPRGPTWLLGYAPVEPEEVELRCGRRPPGSELWRVQIGGRFLAAGGLVYPGGIPYPEDLVGSLATIASEVWLYIDIDRERMVGMYTWPEAIRRPIAARPHAEFGDLRHEWRHALPSHPDWSLLGVADDLALLVAGTVPDPLGELPLYECGGLTLRADPDRKPDYEELVAAHSPPFVVSGDGMGREPGRTLGPQTWPWPAELQWWTSGVTYELKGFVPLARLEDVRRSM